MKEKKALKAVLEAKCPRCRTGNMFDKPVSNLKYLGKMNEHCPECNMRFELEPGFFYGAMYVSYVLSVGIFITTVFILYFVAGDPDLSVYIISVTFLSLLLYPLNLRYSRVLFLHVFGGIKYNPSAHKGLSS